MVYIRIGVENMKYIMFILLVCWSIWFMYNYPDLKPKDNPALYVLGVVTSITTFWIGLEIFVKDNSKI